MKTRIIVTLGLIVGLIGSTFAQKGEKAEERKAEKKAYISERLALTPEESKAFWPVYEKRNADKKEALKVYKQDHKNAKKKLEEMSDDEVKDMLHKSLAKRQAELDHQKKYHEKFMAVLPPKKVAKLYHLEREFRMKKKAEHKGSH